MFEIQTPRRKWNADAVSFGGIHPYVARGENNNGIRGYISEEEKYLNAGNTISFGQDTATMFYQSSPYFTGDKIKIFIPKNFALSRYSALYYITATKKTLKTFRWGSTSYQVKNLEKIEMEIPQKEDASPDTEFMENFIRVVEKLVIKDVIDWLDKKMKVKI